MGSIAKNFCESEWENYKNKAPELKITSNKYEEEDYYGDSSEEEKKEKSFFPSIVNYFKGGSNKIDKKRYKLEKVNKLTVKKIMEMGYTEEMAFHSVRQKGELDQSVNFIIKSPECCTEKYFQNNKVESKLHPSFEESSKKSAKKKEYVPSSPNLVIFFIFFLF